MAAEVSLHFTGRRWPAAAADRSSGSNDAWLIRVSGAGQRWSTNRPLGFWRSFIGYPGLPVPFITMHGDPFGYLDHEPFGRDHEGRDLFLPRGTSTTAKWPELQDSLRRIAAAWEAPDEGGVSRVTRDPQRLREAQDALAELAPAETGLPDLLWVAQGRRLVAKARTLRAFMIASAASALERGIAMRTCAKCFDWFELRRSDAKFCSGSCQAAASKRRLAAAPALTTPRKKDASNGKRAQKTPERKHDLAGRVVGARLRRKASKKK